MCVSNCRAESHKENSQPDVQQVGVDGTKHPPTVRQVRETSPVSHSNGDEDQEAAAAPVKRPSIFGSVALLAESSSSSTPSRHRLSSSSASPFAVASNVDAPPAFVTPPYTPRSRSHQSVIATPLAAPPTPHHHPQHQQPLPSRAEDLTSSLITSPSVMTPDNRIHSHRGLQMNYTPPFTPVRPTTATPLGRPRSRLSLSCPSPLQEMPRPPTAGSLALVSPLYL